MRKKDDVKDAARLDDAPVTQINNSSTFWDWVSRDHPIFTKFIIVIVLLAIVAVSALISWYIPVFFVLALLFGTAVFRKAFFSSEYVLVVSAYDSDPNLLDVLLVGKNKFRKLKKDGNIVPLSTSKGDPVYVAEDYSEGALHFAWVHETSRMEYILERDSFDKVRKLAEESTVKLYSLEHIPHVLGLVNASKIVRKHEEYFSKVLYDSDVSMEEVQKEALDELDEEGVDVL